ncbi:MAG: c-type cytochrome [Anaerolineae bacterium]
MARKRTGWPLIIVGGIVVGLLLAACLGLIWWKMGQPWGAAVPTEFSSNGEQIYFTSTSQRGTPILSDMGMGMMSMMTCASCHGPDGQGGRIWMMMRAFVAPDIRYKTLTSREHAEEEKHKPYTDEDIKRAITRGVEPDGEMLDWPMPRWTMSEEDLNDLLEFLKTLE